MPAAVKVAVPAFAALLPLALNVTAAGGVPVVAQVYVRLASPPSSAPSTDRAGEFAVTGFGLAAAAVASVGGLLGAAGSNSMPSTVALSVTVLKLMTIWPDAFAVAEKSRTTALNAAPAAAKMSKFDSTVVPLITTLKTRFPAAVWNSSAKWSRTV